MNQVILLNYSFDWTMIPLAAWASTGISQEELLELPVESRLGYLFQSNQDSRLRSPEELVDFLYRNNHTSPFRHVHLTYLITSDIATHIQMLKHRVGVEINSESARYKRLKDEYYVPDDLPHDIQELIRANNERLHSLYLDIYNRLIESGYSKQRAKEAARFVLPYSKQITYVVTLSLQALSHLHQLRCSGHAQLEISCVVREMITQLIDTGKFNPVIPFLTGK